MASAMFCFAIVDTLAKLLTDSFHPLQIVWMRQLGLGVGVVVYLIVRGPGALKSAKPYWQIVRGAAAALSATLFIFGIAHIALTDATAITFVAPLFVTILGATVLREPVGIRRWSAVFVGFLGTIIIVRPGFESFHPAYFLIFTAAFLFAVRQVVSRHLSTVDKTATTVAYTAFASILMLGVFQPAVWITPETGIHIAMIVAMAALGGAGEFLVIKSPEIATSVSVAPMHYTIIIWTSLYGYLVFDKIPDTLFWVGTILIIMSGLYVLARGNKK